MQGDRFLLRLGNWLRLVQNWFGSSSDCRYHRRVLDQPNSRVFLQLEFTLLEGGTLGWFDRQMVLDRHWRVSDGGGLGFGSFLLRARSFGRHIWHQLWNQDRLGPS